MFFADTLLAATPPPPRLMIRHYAFSHFHIFAAADDFQLSPLMPLTLFSAPLMPLYFITIDYFLPHFQIRFSFSMIFLPAMQR
jgi:hypothetical protein